jgi:Pentapeptide repeats (8 copies)
MEERRWSSAFPLPAGYVRANLSGANLGSANVSGADLLGANLSGADLLGANLSEANLGSANVSGANVGGANLSGADLRATRMDVATMLTNAGLDAHTRLADVVWNDVPVTRLNWDDVAILGDEQWALEHTFRAGDPRPRGGGWTGKKSKGTRPLALRPRRGHALETGYAEILTILI